MMTARVHRWTGVLLLGSALAMVATTCVPVGATPPPDVIVLPGATSTEGIAAGRGSTFYAGEIFTGDIFRGDIRQGTAERWIDAPDGRQAAGMVVDLAHGYLFVAGGLTGQAYVYDIDTGATVAVIQLTPAVGTLVNDVALSKDGAWFTNSNLPELYFVPVSGSGEVGPVTTLPLSGPAADAGDMFNLNGIRATPDGQTLIVGHSGNGELYTVDPATGASAVIAGVSVPNNDGILSEAGRVWVVQNFNNQVAQVRLSPDLSSGVVEEIITDDDFQVPTTAARFGNRLALVNAKFDTGFPPTASQYEVVIVPR